MARSTIAVAAGLALVGKSMGQQAFIGNGISVSYNQGGLDWINAGDQTLDSVGANTPASGLGTNNCVNYTTIQQSPIDIIYGSVSSALVTNNAILDPKLPASLAVTYPPTSDYKVEMNDHTLEVKFNLANSWNTESYGFNSPAFGFLPATQLHFHSPSEHTINGYHAPLEMHIVNQKVTAVNTTTKLASATVPGAVIAIMFRFTPDNTASAWLEPLLDATPTTLLFSKFVQLAASNQFAAKNNSVEAESPGTLDLGQIVAQADPTKFFTYNGTLTTPNCAQSVTFYILKNPLPVSYNQVIRFTNLLARAQGGMSRGADNRPPNAYLHANTVKMNSGMNAALYPAPIPVVPCNLSGAIAAAPRTLLAMAVLAVSALALAF